MVIVFGSINLDLIFSMEDLPAPGATLLARSMRTEPGGKGANQAVAAARDGASVAMFGAVGRDGFAEDALAGLLRAGVDLSGVARVAAPTGVASIVTDRAGRNAIAVASGANLLAQQAAIPDTALRGATVVVQMECDPLETSALISRAHALGAKTILNLAPAALLPQRVLAQCALIVVNESEAAFLGEKFECNADARSLSMRVDSGVVRTLGDDGVEAFVEGRAIAMTARRVAAIDTTAAGDCFVGVLAAALDRGESLEAALARANVAAAMTCTMSGSQGSMPDAAEIDGAGR
ncbi:MAG: ribokinase [Hyphomicrobiales bacterium]|nr:ribokinase [Hyphomicrobiales bacterium]